MLLYGILLPFFVAEVGAHFVLWTPPSIGYVDTDEGIAPCGGVNPQKRDPLVEWSVAGYPISLLSTHQRAKWQVRAALLNDSNSWVNMIPDIDQQGLGAFCLPSTPGVPSWVGLDAVVQITATTVDGALYQCAAVRFTSSNAAPITPDCKNSSLLQASFVSQAPSATGSGTPTPTTNSAVPTPSSSKSAAPSSAPQRVVGFSVYGFTAAVVTLALSL